MMEGHFIKPGLVEMLRRRKDWRQVDVAQKAKVSPRTVHRMECKKGGATFAFSLRSIMAVATALGVEYRTLIDGERQPGQQQEMVMQEELAFIKRVLSVFDDYGPAASSLMWQVGDHGVQFSVLCNDTFWWGCADGERITPENVGELEQAVRDCREVNAAAVVEAAFLFVARVRKMRPQGAAYPSRSDLWALFDACGPARDVGLGNPHPHPSEEVKEKP